MKTGISFLEKAANKFSLIFLSSFLLITVLSQETVLAQEVPLNRKISIDIENKPLAEVLFLIGRTAKFNVSYNSRILPGDSLVSISTAKIPAKEVFAQLLGDKYKFKSISNHVIIKKGKPKKNASKKPKKWTLHGQISHAISHEPIAMATVYEDSKDRTALTNAQGEYEIEIPWTQKFVAVSMSKVGFRDTVVVVRAKKDQYLTQGLLPAYHPVEEVPSLAVTGIASGGPKVEDFGIVRILVPNYQRSLTDNVMQVLRKIPVQFSVIPGVSTNGLLSGGMNNVLSVNLFAGYSNGVRGVEIGGLLNINRGDMIGIQTAGLGNMVGGKVMGLQGAGLANFVLKDFSGLQTAGLVNLAKGNFRGFQSSGLVNLVAKEMYGLQVAGLANYSERLHGAQIGGLINFAKNVDQGIQFGGIGNLSQGTAGVQIGGLFNYAKKVNGMQIGFVNVSDTLNGGAIGFVNISKTGYMRLEFSGNEFLHSTLKFKSGGNKFYTLWGLGTSRFFGKKQDGYFAGLGFRKQMGRFFLEGEGLVTHVAWIDNSWFNEMNLVITAAPSLGIRVFGPLELIGGASFNWHLAQSMLGIQTLDLAVNPTFVKPNGTIFNQTWVGFKAGVQVNLNGTWRSQRKNRKSRNETSDSDSKK